jgi:fumarate reductase subunit C
MTRSYIRAIPFTWWLRKRPYLLFMLRELTVVFIAAFLVLTLVELARLARGADAYQTLLDRLRSPGWVVFHLLALVAAVYHSVTWFNLAPKIMVVRIGEERLSPALVAAVNYGIWFVLSAGIAWITLRSR